MRLAIREGREGDNLPEPETMPFAPDEFDLIYDLWVIWSATDKKYLPSQLIPELLSGHGRLLAGVFEVDAMYSKVKKQLKRQNPGNES